MLATAAANSVVAIRITRRGPYLSSMGPISGEQTASSSVLTETAADTCVRPQPNSAASGLMKTLMLARKVGEMLNASPMTQDSRTTGAYLMHPLSRRRRERGLCDWGSDQHGPGSCIGSSKSPSMANVRERNGRPVHFAQRQRIVIRFTLQNSLGGATRRDANETNRRKSLFVATQSG